MKKIFIGICGFASCCWLIATLSNEAVLKAGEQTNDPVGEVTVSSESSLTDSSTVVPSETIVWMEENDNPNESLAEPSNPTESAEIEDSGMTSESDLLPESSTLDVSQESTVSSSSNELPTSSSSQSSNSSETTTTSMNPGVTESSTSSSSENRPNTSTTNSSVITTPSTAPSMNQESSREKEPELPSINPPTGANSNVPAYPAPTVQATEVLRQEAPTAFGTTSTLKLSEELKISEVAPSDLKGYELPLLSSFSNKNQAALIYAAIQQLGVEQSKDMTIEQLIIQLYRDLFAIEIIEQAEKAEEIPSGNLLYKQEKNDVLLQGIYLGQNYYLTLIESEVEDDTGALSSQQQLSVESLESLESGSDYLAQPIPTSELTDYGKQLLAEYPASINFTENEAAKKFIATIAMDAQKLGQEYDVFASVMIAQALLESGSGTSSLSLAPNYNLFGIKGTYQGQSVSMSTQEDRGNGELYSIQSAFRRYPNYAASLGDYVELLRGGISGNANYYENTWRSVAKNYLKATQALTGSYATDSSYGKKLSSIIALYHLTQYDRPKETQSSGVFIKGKAEIPSEYRTLMRYPDYNGINYNSSGSYPIGQCTWYAYNRVKQLGKSVDDYMGNGGEWGVKGKLLGYQTSQEPQAGWLISFNPGTAGSDPRYGHVAFVEAVRPEGILISEGNVYGGTIISYRVIASDLARSHLVTYIKAK